jgi:hypothetical protein
MSWPMRQAWPRCPKMATPPPPRPPACTLGWARQHTGVLTARPGASVQVASTIGAMFQAYGDEWVDALRMYVQREGMRLVGQEALWHELVQAAQAAPADCKRTKNACRALLRAKQGVGSRFQARAA